MVSSLSQSGRRGTLDDLFRPGPGRLPPHIAGRDAELDLLDRFKSSLGAGRGVGSDVILRGPRGTGKTVLLNEFGNRLRDAGVEVLAISAAEIGGLAHLIEKIAPPSWWEKYLPALRGGRLGTEEFHVNIDMDKLVRKSDIRDALTARAEKGPFVFLLDEAHEMDGTVGAPLINAFQGVGGAGLPVMLVLAGTPGTTRHLETMGASFVERNLDVPVGLLDSKASGEALTVPLERHGVSFDPDTLRDVVRDSQGYPFFLQLWGEAITDILVQQKVPTITMEQINQAKSRVDERRNKFYQRRRRELATRGLKNLALAVGRAYQHDGGCAVLSSEALMDTMSLETLPPGTDKEQALDILEDRGFVWDQGGDEYVPGIRSLMGYLEDRAREMASTSARDESESLHDLSEN